MEYAFGMQIGFAIGWITGLFIGRSYVEHFEPVYFEGLSRLHYWRGVPYMIARYSAVIGVVVGMIAIAVINYLILTRSKESDNPDTVIQRRYL